VTNVALEIMGSINHEDNGQVQLW